MQCDVAREALSARIDGEREPVPAARVDEHLQTCPDCRAWHALADAQAKRMVQQITEQGHDLAANILASAGIDEVGRAHRLTGWIGRYGARSALVVVGVLQVLVAVAQMSGAHFGMLSMAHPSGATDGEHLMNETTAWSLALGLGLAVAGVWPVTAAGVAGVVGIFAAVLAWYEFTDSIADEVTVARVLSHLPVLFGAVLAALVYRQSQSIRPTPPPLTADGDIVLPDKASRGRRRGHLRSSTDSAA